MAFNITTTMSTIQTHLEGATDSEGQPIFVEVAIGMPTSPEPDGPSARISASTMAVVDTTLNRLIEQHVLSVRLYRARHTDAEEDREVDTHVFVNRVLDVLIGDFSLGAEIRNIDFAGEYGQGLEVEFADSEIGETPYHVATITLPLIVNGATTLVA